MSPVGGVAQRVPVRDADLALAAGDQPLGLERLEHAVDVYRGQPERIADLLDERRDALADLPPGDLGPEGLDDARHLEPGPLRRAPAPRR